MNIFEFMAEKYANREDKDNILPVGISDAEFREICIDYLLGEDWYVVTSMNGNQTNECAMSEILMRYSSRYRKEHRRRKRKR